MTELKPCPFCGKKEADIFERPEPLFRGMFYPECRWCSAELPAMHSRKEAIDTWNSRVNEMDDIWRIVREKRLEDAKEN